MWFGDNATKELFQVKGSLQRSVFLCLGIMNERDVAPRGKTCSKVRTSSKTTLQSRQWKMRQSRIRS